VVALVIILFEGGLTTKPGDLRRAALPGAALATVGVLITAAVTGAAVHLVLGVDPLTAALLGAVVASTDAAAVFDVLRKAPLPPRLAAVLRVESGANDPVAIALTLGLLELWSGTASGGQIAVFGLIQLAGGLAIGAVVGYLGALLLRHLSLGTDTLYPVLALAIAGLAYGAAAQVGASGFLATFVAGSFVGALVPRRRPGIQGFHAGLASVADIGLFLVLGLLVSPANLPQVMLAGLAVAAALTFLARPLAVAVTIGPAKDLSWQDATVLGWTGLRGAVPIVLATFPFAVGHPAAEDIFNVVFFVVLVSTLVQGATVTPLARRLGVAADRPGWSPVAEALPLEDVDVDIVEVDITGRSPRCPCLRACSPWPSCGTTRRSSRAVTPGCTRVTSCSWRSSPRRRARCSRPHGRGASSTRSGNLVHRRMPPPRKGGTDDPPVLDGEGDGRARSAHGNRARGDPPAAGAVAGAGDDGARPRGSAAPARCGHRGQPESVTTRPRRCTGSDQEAVDGPPSMRQGPPPDEGSENRCGTVLRRHCSLACSRSAQQPARAVTSMMTAWAASLASTGSATSTTAPATCRAVLPQLQLSPHRSAGSRPRGPASRRGR
jgi:potassium/hydrogen antiporter